MNGTNQRIVAAVKDSSLYRQGGTEAKKSEGPRNLAGTDTFVSCTRDINILSDAGAAKFLGDRLFRPVASLTAIG